MSTITVTSSLAAAAVDPASLQKPNKAKAGQKGSNGVQLPPKMLAPLPHTGVAKVAAASATQLAAHTAQYNAAKGAAKPAAAAPLAEALTFEPFKRSLGALTQSMQRLTLDALPAAARGTQASQAAAKPNKEEERRKRAEAIDAHLKQGKKQGEMRAHMTQVAGAAAVLKAPADAVDALYQSFCDVNDATRLVCDLREAGVQNWYDVTGVTQLAQHLQDRNEERRPTNVAAYVDYHGVTPQEAHRYLSDVNGCAVHGTALATTASAGASLALALRTKLLNPQAVARLPRAAVSRAAAARIAPPPSIKIDTVAVEPRAARERKPTVNVGHIKKNARAILNAQPTPPRVYGAPGEYTKLRLIELSISPTPKASPSRLFVANFSNEGYSLRYLVDTILSGKDIAASVGARQLSIGRPALFGSELSKHPFIDPSKCREILQLSPESSLSKITKRETRFSAPPQQKDLRILESTSYRLSMDQASKTMMVSISEPIKSSLNRGLSFELLCEMRQHAKAAGVNKLYITIDAQKFLEKYGRDVFRHIDLETPFNRYLQLLERRFQRHAGGVGEAGGEMVFEIPLK